MDTGTKISGIAHAGLIGAALFGGLFTTTQQPVETQSVSVVTSQEFAALLAAQDPPETATEPAAPAAPEPDTQPPEIATPEPADPIDQSAPETTDAPVAGEVPDALPDPLPDRPETEAVDTAPAIQPPEDIESPLPPAAVARPEPRPAERVAPTPVAAPPPDARIDDVPTPDTSPDPGAEAPAPPEQAAAPEEATDRIAPETSDSNSLAPAASIRPPARRPNPPARSQPRSTEDAVNAALAEALTESDPTPTATPAPSGPPLTSGEKSDLIVAVSKCWNVGSLSTDALNTTVVVGLKMTEDAKPVTSSIRLISASGGSDGAAQQAFQAARRAIIRCGAGGYSLPAEKYGQWRDIEMTFNPERMRIR